MICPYIQKSKTTTTDDRHTYDKDDFINGSVKMETIIIEYIECQKELCGAWSLDHCEYSKK